MIDTALVIVKNVLTMSVATILVVALLWLLFQLFTLWYKWKDREKRSLDLTTLLVVVPEDNEVKVDAMEQIINSFASLYKGARFKFMQRFVAQPSLSLEIIGTSEDIRF